MNDQRQLIPGVGWAFVLLGSPLVVAGALWITATSDGASAASVATFLALAVVASTVFAFGAMRLSGLPLRTCAALSALGGAVSLVFAAMIGFALLLGN